MDQPCALHGIIKKVCEECKLTLLWPDWNVICANVLIHSINSSHVPTVLVNHEGLCDVNRLLVSQWPSLCHPQWFNAMTIRYHRDHTDTVVIPSRDHDFSCQILPVAIWSASSSSFTPTSPDIYPFGWLAPSQSPEGPFCSFMKWNHVRKQVICSGMHRVSSCHSKCVMNHQVRSQLEKQQNLWRQDLPKPLYLPMYFPRYLPR